MIILIISSEPGLSFSDTAHYRYWSSVDQFETQRTFKLHIQPLTHLICTHRHNHGIHNVDVSLLPDLCCVPNPSLKPTLFLIIRELNSHQNSQRLRKQTTYLQKPVPKVQLNWVNQMVRILFTSVPTSCCSSSGYLSPIFPKAHQTLSRFPVARISIIKMNRTSMFLLLKPVLNNLLKVVAARSDLPLGPSGWRYSKNVQDDPLLEKDLPAEVAGQQHDYQRCTNQQLRLSAHKNIWMIVHHYVLSRKQ